jgi:hypothetical protein
LILLPKLTFPPSLGVTRCAALELLQFPEPPRIREMTAGKI